MSTSAQNTQPVTVEPAVEPTFWSTYETTASDYDDKLLSRANHDMGIILTFAGLFSTVNSSFIVGMQPNPVDTTNALMIQMINIMTNGTGTMDIISPSAPSTTWAQASSYASLMCSLLAAFGVLISKPWFDSFALAPRLGSLDEYGMKRQRKLNQLERQLLKIVLKAPYFLLLLSLFLFVLSLMWNPWTQQSFYIISVVVFLLPIFYYMVILDAILHRDSPFTHVLYFIRPLTLVSRWPPNEDVSVKLSAIDWLLRTSVKPDVIEAVAAMVPLMQWLPDYNVSAIYGHLRDAFATYRHNRELSMKCGKAMAHLCLQPAKIRVDLTLLRQDLEAWGAWGGNSLFIRDAFMSGRSAWKEFRMTKGQGDRQKLEANARTALRTMVVHGRREQLSYPDDEKLIWEGDLQWRHENGDIPCPEEFDWLVDYLTAHETDAETQRDALLALGAMRGLGSDAKRRSYVEALIHCMNRSGHKEVRYAAIRAISDAREELSSITGDLMPHGVDVGLLDELSRALLAAVHPNDVPDVERDPIPSPSTRCYLRLIFTLAKNRQWCNRLRSNPDDLKEWFTLTEDASLWKFDFNELHFYRLGIYLRVYPDGMDHPLDPTQQEKWGTLTRRAWSGLSTILEDQDFHDCLETIPAFVTETERNLPTRARLPIEDLQMLSRDVDLVLQKAKEDESLDPAILEALRNFYQKLDGMLGDT